MRHPASIFNWAPAWVETRFRVAEPTEANPDKAKGVAVEDEVVAEEEADEEDTRDVTVYEAKSFGRFRTVAS